MDTKQTISVVVPCYNEEESLPIFLNELAAVAESMKSQTPPRPALR